MKQFLVAVTVLVGVLGGISGVTHTIPTAFAQQEQTGPCQIINARFNPNGIQPNLLKLVNGVVTQPPVDLTINTRNCVGKNLRVYLLAQAGGESAVDIAANVLTYLNIYGLISQGYEATAFDNNGKVQRDTVKFNFLANEKPCKTSSSKNSFDCIISIQIQDLETKQWIYSSIMPEVYSSITTERTDPQGVLMYECINDSDGTTSGVSICSSHDTIINGGVFGNIVGQRGDWKFVGATGWAAVNAAGEPIAIDGVTDFNTDSPCYDPNLNEGSGGYIAGCTALLAPLPGIEKVDASFTFGRYINAVVRLAIGLIVVFAVVMMIIQGFQYLTEGSISGKAMSKQKLTNALIGVLIALGMFIILATINPNLLNLEPQIDQVDVSFDDENGDSGAPLGQDTPGQKTSPKCPEGFRDVSGIMVCQKIAGNVEKLVAAAKADGFDITGYGFRDPAKQIEIRRKNCGTSNYDIYEKPSRQCTPPAARPGSSRHENGFAIDFKERGKQTVCYSVNPNRATCKDPLYLWLVNNAQKFGLSNRTSEPWHWSTDGK